MPTRWFCPHPSSWVNERVLAIAQRRMVNLFVVRTVRGAIAIDTGAAAEGLAESLDAVGVDASQVTHVFLTHCDSDHVGGRAAFPQARVFLGAGEEALLQRQRRRFLGLTYVPRLERPYNLLADDETVAADGLTVRALATPGHTPGSTSYLVDERWLFTGDCIALREGVAQPFYRLMDMERVRLPASLVRLARLSQVNLLCTAHTGCTTNWQRAMQPWRAPAREE